MHKEHKLTVLHFKIPPSSPPFKKIFKEHLILALWHKIAPFCFLQAPCICQAGLVLLFYYFLSLIGRLVNILLWFGIQSFPHYQTIKKSMTAWDILTHSNLDLNYGHATYLATLFPPEFFRVYLPPVNPFPKVQVQCPPCFFGWVLFLSI